MDIGPIPILVMENTSETHNVVVCTLCSCYPRFLLGRPPDWYKSRSYRSRTVREPRRVLAEFGTEVGPDVDIRVHDSTADMRYMILPMRPAGTEDMSEEATGRARYPGQPDRRCRGRAERTHQQHFVADHCCGDSAGALQRDRSVFLAARQAG